jgi:ATP-binding cassette subfamily F protein 3
MLSFQDLSLRRGGRLLFGGVDLTVFPGQKVGLTGANGSGKSSLLALVRGELTPDEGSVALPPAWVVAHVAQETPAVDAPAVEYVMDGDAELRQVQADMARAEQAGEGTRLAELHAQLEAIDGYRAHARAARLLHGLGFSPEEQTQPVRSFSGGWRMRLNLARALMCRSDLLLLDEPTNHLDLDAVLWLQDWLRTYPGTLLLISHDRDFLDLVVERIAHVEQQGLRVYEGNYSAFERQRAEALAQQQSLYERQQREIHHMEDFVRRFRAKATKARQAQSRLKALERLERIAPAHVDSPFHFRFFEPPKMPHPLLQLEGAAVSYGDTPVLTGVGLSLEPGDRIGLLGRNGAGKSTLIKLLAGALEPGAGRRLPAPDLRIGYFAQHQLEQLHADASPLLQLQRLDPKATEQELRDFLGGFGFAGDKALEPCGPFSGGEKARLVLALTVYQRPNLLLLDEPTNHLDLEMRHALAMALQDFEGAMVVVSHDRHLLRTVTDTLLLVADGGAQPFDGDLDDYARWLAQLRSGEEDNGPAADGEHTAGARKERRRQDAERRERLKPLRRELERLNKALDQLQAEQAALEQSLADPEIYADGARDRLKALLADKARVDAELGAVEERWLEVGEALEGED